MNMQRPRRVYVKLLCEFMASGQIRPLALTLPDGRHYNITRLVLEERATPSSAGPTTAKRYEVVIRRQLRPIWQEDSTNRWFVESPPQ